MVQEHNSQSFDESAHETEKTFEGSENNYSESGEDSLESSGSGDVSGDYEYYYDDSGDGQGSGNDYGSKVKIHRSLRTFRSKGGNSLPGNLLDNTNRA